MDVYGLIGNPVGHSLSPRMQEAGFAAIGQDARYVTFEPPTNGGVAAVEAAAHLGLRGLNVTIPFKEAVLAAVDVETDARRIGAVNTIDLSGDHPAGYNTDLEGAMRALRHHDVTVADRETVLVGAGGAARAIAFGLVDAGASLTIANRTVERAERLAEEFDDVRASDLESLPRLLSEASILINATSVGMESDESVVPREALHGDLVVMDAVYRPLETTLLREAAAVGATTIDGAWMLLFQGTAAFERWTGTEAPVEVMNTALRDAL